MTFASEKFDRSFTHHTIQVNGVRLHYLIGGKGDGFLRAFGEPGTIDNR